MQLNSGELFWPENPRVLPPQPRLDRDIRCDVAVVGAGITGALVADELVGAGLDTVILDKRTVGCGSTAANTALLLYELDTHLKELVEIMGETRAARIYRACVEAVREAGTIAKSLDGDCGYTMRPSLYIASDAKNAGELADECSLRQKHNIVCQYLDEKQIAERFPFARPAAILSQDAAQLNPYQFTQLLIGRAMTRGVRVFEKTEVALSEPTTLGVRLLTTTGLTVRARYVVYATGYECAGEFSAPLTTVQTTYAVVSESVENFDGWTDRCLIWETARPYFYLRTTSDNRIMIGGEDDDSTVPPTAQTLAHKSRRLQRRFRELFPQVPFRPAKSWAGIFKSTRDGLPFIGPRPGDPRILYALGYGGNGMTFSIIAAHIIRDLCMGRENADVKMFGFER